VFLKFPKDKDRSNIFEGFDIYFGLGNDFHVERKLRG